MLPQTGKAIAAAGQKQVSEASTTNHYRPESKPQAQRYSAPGAPAETIFAALIFIIFRLQPTS
jgi:hypothetical protein